MNKEMRDLLKDGDITAKNLWVKVLDEESGKEGWISMSEIIESIAEDISSVFHGSGKVGGKND